MIRPLQLLDKVESLPQLFDNTKLQILTATIRIDGTNFIRC
jgi:hypothetical protein